MFILLPLFSTKLSFSLQILRQLINEIRKVKDKTTFSMRSQMPEVQDKRMVCTAPGAGPQSSPAVELGAPRCSLASLPGTSALEAQDQGVTPGFVSWTSCFPVCFCNLICETEIILLPQRCVALHCNIKSSKVVECPQDEKHPTEKNLPSLRFMATTSHPTLLWVLHWGVTPSDNK